MAERLQHDEIVVSKNRNVLEKNSHRHEWRVTTPAGNSASLWISVIWKGSTSFLLFCHACAPPKNTKIASPCLHHFWRKKMRGFLHHFWRKKMRGYQKTCGREQRGPAQTTPRRHESTVLDSISSIIFHIFFIAQLNQLSNNGRSKSDESFEGGQIDHQLLCWWIGRSIDSCCQSIGAIDG